MENSPLLDNDLNRESGLSLSSDAQYFLQEGSKWAKFLGILGFIGVGFLVLGGFSIMGAGSLLSGMGDMPFSPGLFGLLYIIIAILYFIPSLYLYNFANKAQAALRNNDSGMLTESIGFLRSTFKFFGIFAIIGIAMYFLLVIVFMATGMQGLMQG